MGKYQFYDYGMTKVRLCLQEGNFLYSDDKIENARQAVDVMKKSLSELDREYFTVVNFDGENIPMNFNVVSIGDINTSLVPVQNSFKSAILTDAKAVMVFHNHPSGDTHPSDEDIRTTERLLAAGRLLGIPVLDHVIIGGGTGECYSLRENSMAFGLSFDDVPDIGEYPKIVGVGEGSSEYGSATPSLSVKEGPKEFEFGEDELKRLDPEKCFLHAHNFTTMGVFMWVSDDEARIVHKGSEEECKAWIEALRERKAGMPDEMRGDARDGPAQKCRRGR